MSDDLALARKLIRRANKARSFPKHTCGASRYLLQLAEQYANPKRPMPDIDRELIAPCLAVVVAELWERRVAMDPNK